MNFCDGRRTSTFELEQRTCDLPVVSVDQTQLRPLLVEPVIVERALWRGHVVCSTFVEKKRLNGRVIVRR